MSVGSDSKISVEPAAGLAGGKTSFSAFRNRGFLLFAISRTMAVIAIEMVSVAVGWQIYDLTHKPLSLGLAGLAQCIPGVLLFLAAGHVADHCSRKRLLVACALGYAFCATLLLHFALRGVATVGPIYLAVLLIGVVRTFEGPVRSSILTEIVPEESFATAVAWLGSIQKTATMTGPMLGGLIYALGHGPKPVYVAGMIGGVVAAAFAAPIVGRPRAANPRGTDLRTVLAGLHYIREHRIILGAISLDLFAVLLGGAVGLLPVYARDILRTGPWGLGLLRSAPAIGATLMGAVVAHWRLRGNVGKTMLWCVAVFGTATIVFGLSRSLLLSMAALLILGAGDMVSVIIRQTLVQIATPDEMRGRVSAVNMLFIGTSNQLGEFESGVTAAWFGTVAAVVVGGVGSIAVVALWAWLFPELRKVDQLTASELRVEPQADGALAP
jgi:MFS family permease